MAQEVFQEKHGRGTVTLIDEEGINPMPKSQQQTLQPISLEPEDPIKIFENRVEEIKKMKEDGKIDLAISNAKALQTAISQLLMAAFAHKDTANLERLKTVGEKVNELVVALAPLVTPIVPSVKPKGQP